MAKHLTHQYEPYDGCGLAIGTRTQRQGSAGLHGRRAPPFAASKGRCVPDLHNFVHQATIIVGRLPCQTAMQSDLCVPRDHARAADRDLPRMNTIELTKSTARWERPQECPNAGTTNCVVTLGGGGGAV